MSLGRIKRDRRKVAKARAAERSPRSDTRTIKIKVRVRRTMQGGYTALACIGDPPRAKLKSIPHQVFRVRCGFPRNARSPQSAIALTLKSLSQAIAKRGRKFR